MERYGEGELNDFLDRLDKDDRNLQKKKRLKYYFYIC